MFRTDDPRTYALPLVRTLDALQTVDTVALSDPASHTTLREVEDTIADQLDTDVDVIANLDYGADQRHDHNLTTQPFYRHHLPDDGPWVVYQAHVHKYDLPDTVDHALNLDVIYTADGTLLADAYYAMPSAGETLHRGSVTEFSLAEAFHAGLTAFERQSTGMIRADATPTEVIDFLHTDWFQTPMEHWASDRSTGYEAIRSNRENARSKLIDASWPDALTEKPTITVDDSYHEILDVYKSHIDATTRALEAHLSEDDRNEAVDQSILKTAVIEAYAMTADKENTETAIADLDTPSAELVLHALRLFAVATDTYARRARKLTHLDFGHETDMDSNSLGQRADELFTQLDTELPDDYSFDSLT